MAIFQTIDLHYLCIFLYIYIYIIYIYTYTLYLVYFCFSLGGLKVALAIFQTIDLPSDPCALPSFNKPPVAKVEVCVCGIGVTSDLHHNTKHIFSESRVTHYPIIH